MHTFEYARKSRVTMGNGRRLAVLLAVLACLGCEGSDRTAPGHDLTGMWEATGAECMLDPLPEDLDLPTGLPPEVSEQYRQLLDPANWESGLETTVRIVQTGDMLEIFDVEEIEEGDAFSGTVTGDSLEYSLSQDGAHIQGQGVIVSPALLEIEHVITLEEPAATVSCEFDAMRL